MANRAMANRANAFAISGSIPVLPREFFAKYMVAVHVFLIKVTSPWRWEGGNPVAQITIPNKTKRVFPNVHPSLRLGKFKLDYVRLGVVRSG